MLIMRFITLKQKKNLNDAISEIQAKYNKK